MAVIKLLINQFTPVTATTIFEEPMKRLGSVREKSWCGNRVHKPSIAI